MIIKPITTPEDARQVVQVEVATWEMDLASAVPIHILMAVAENGGLLLGAYEGKKLIGFTLGWLGTVGNKPRPADRHLKLVSHLTGVLPEFRDLRVGYQLKLAQRRWAMERGLDLIAWTFDPLESRNANLNMRRLGCICQIYLSDFYGEMDDQMSVGIESDRFQVEWWIKSKRVKERLTPSADSGPRLQDAQLLNPATLGPDGYPRPAEQPAELIGARLLVEIPSDMQAIRRTDMALGIAWRYHSRALLKSTFAAGYLVTDFIFERDSSPPRSFYLLEQMDADEVDRCRLGS